MAQHELTKSITAKKIDKSGQPIGVHTYPVPAGAIVDDLFEEHGVVHFLWHGTTYGVPAGILGRAYKEVD